MVALSTELPWKLQLVERPTPTALRTGQVDVVQVSSHIGVRAIEAVRSHKAPVGPVLLCVTHLLMHIPVENGTAPRWYVPQALCRPSAFTCSVPGHAWGRNACRRIWLMPEDPTHPTTDGAELQHHVALARSTPATVA